MRTTAAVLALVTAAGLGTAVSAATAASGAAAAPSGTVLSAPDARNDVKIYRQREGASEQVRRSIDLREVTVRRQGGGARFTVELKQVLPASAAVTQVAYLAVTPDASSGQTWSLDLGMTPQRPGAGYANYDADTTTGATGGDRFCGDLRTRVRRGKDTVSITVPRRCLPSDPGVLSLTTLVGGFRDDTPAQSLDTLVVPVIGALRG